MSLALVKAELLKFLADKSPGVFCLTGEWGVGKTYAWNALLKQAREANSIGYKRYAYVSLFGIDSLDGARSAIFENTVASKDAGKSASLETLQNNTNFVLKTLGRKSLGFLQNNPVTEGYSKIINPIAHLLVTETVICFDDIERRGSNLAIRDLFGLISSLREQKSCKSLVILNRNELSEEDRVDFDKYLEKTVDALVEFDPSAQECAEVALEGNSRVHIQLRKECVRLGIRNIRIIKRIERASNEIEGILKDFEERVRHQGTHTTAFLVWQTLSTDAPSLEFLEQKRSRARFGMINADDLSVEERRWNSLLNDYDFGEIDPFDRVILDGISKGYFDKERLRAEAQTLQDKLRSQDREGEFHDAWELFHNSFDPNEAEIVAAISAAFRNTINSISANNLDGTIRLLKDLGRTRVAKELLAYFMANRIADRDFFDLSHQPLGAPKDPDVVAAFQQKFNSFRDSRDPKDVLIKIAKNNGWSNEDTALLRSLSVDDFYKIFKSTKGTDLDRVVRVALDFGRIGGIKAEDAKIAQVATDALVRIGKESRLNARRVGKYIAL